MTKIITIPRVEKADEVIVTGNHYVSLPDISPQGEISSINLLSSRALGLIEFKGSAQKPFLSPYFKINQQRAVLRSHEHMLIQNWIPRFGFDVSRGRCEVTYLAPYDEKGISIIFFYKNKSNASQRITMGLEGSWAVCCHTIFKSYKLRGDRFFWYDDWTESLVLELRRGLLSAALALRGEKSDNYGYAINDADLKGAANKIRAEDQDILNFYLEKEFEVQPGQEITWPIYMGINIEGDGASTTSVHLNRCGWQTLFTDTVSWLQKRQIKIKDSDIEKLANRNLFFNYYFAAGRGFEDENLYLLTSRSPRYYVSAAYWPRDALFWSFPGLLILDKEMAAEALYGVFERHWRNGGIHSQYINGTVLYGGFELDQLCSYIIALDMFCRQVPKNDLLSKLPISDIIKDFLSQLSRWKSDNEYLYGTFLDPADDPPTYPYLTYNQVLVWKALGCLPSLKRHCRLSADTWLGRLGIAKTRKKIREALFKHAVCRGPEGEKVLAGTFDGQGNYELYENPPGSLALLPYYGFLTAEDPLYLNTMKWINSTYNPYYKEEGICPGTGALHAANPWVLSVAGEILAGYKVHDRMLWLKNAALDGGLACETVDPTTGRAFTGRAFASCAGFLGYSLYYRFGKEKM